MANISKPSNLSTIWASAGNAVAPADAKIAQGWVVELPPYQTANFIENKQDSYIAHTNQHGIPDWDNATEYQGGISYTKGSDGVVYKAIRTNVNVDPSIPTNNQDWVKAFEDFGSVAVVAADLAALDAQYRTLSGLSSVSAARNNLSVYSKQEGDSRYAYKNGEANQVFSVATATQSAHAIPLGQLNSLLVSATETVKGIAEIADVTEAVNGTDDSTIMTPKKVRDNFLRRANNLSDLTNVAQARVNLGITSTATVPESTFVRDESLVGQVATFARTTAPSGWLVCDGRAVSRTTYSALFAAIGTTYGGGNGSTTFNLPDCRNEFFRGWNGNVGTVGDKFSQSYQSHNHTASTSADGHHGHSGSTGSSGHHSHSGSTNSAGAHTHSVSAARWIGGHTDNGGAPDQRSTQQTFNTSSSGNHTHTLSINGGGAHSHTVSISGNGSHTHTVTVNNSGGTETRPRGIYFLICIRH